jgi:hypothetical protein
MIAFLLASVFLISGDDPAETVNAKVAAFARSKLGEQVGDGECTTLVNQALGDSGGKVLRQAEADGEYRWGELVKSVKEAKPGDIVQLEKVSFQGRRQKVGRNGEPILVISKVSYPHHSGIITKVGPKGKTLTVLHQNGPGPDGHSLKTVQETIFVISEKQPGGSMKIYRPLVAD